LTFSHVVGRDDPPGLAPTEILALGVVGRDDPPGLAPTEILALGVVGGDDVLSGLFPNKFDLCASIFQRICWPSIGEGGIDDCLVGVGERSGSG
jgi:hypothetical protein